MLWMENIVESIPISPFFTNFRVHMASFVDSHKVIVKKNAFSVHLSAQIGSENKKKKKKKL